ncbi:MAG: endonuclease III domain-containing protein [Candidatus Hodarchaeota archaeon]
MVKFFNTSNMQVQNKISLLYEWLNTQYPQLEPHGSTWLLWLKKKTPYEIFEVAIGTILVQNTNWRNVNKAIENLKNESFFSFEEIHKLDLDRLEGLIKPAGFYRQKAEYLKSLSELFLSHKTNRILTRAELLNCKGIGKETADSILVYCFQHPIPIVGTYTRRLFARINGKVDYLKRKYEVIQEELRKNLKHEAQVFGRFHALVVCHSQTLCHKIDPKCAKCGLIPHCIYGKNWKNKPEIAFIQSVIEKKASKLKN